MSSGLTIMQRKYIWLMGSFPDLVMTQGRGYRTEKLMYARRGEELVIFGYSNPPLWLARRGLIRPLQAPNTYTLDDDGEKTFVYMLARGEGGIINRLIREVE